MRNCTPQRSNPQENAATIVRYIEARPDRWPERFTVLAEEALMEAFPCNK